MVKFQLNEEQYQTPEGWHEIEFGKFLNYLGDISSNEPELHKEFMQDHIEFLEELSEDLSQEEKEKIATERFLKKWHELSSSKKLICYKFYALSIGFWCDIEQYVILESMDRGQLFNAYWTIQADLNINALTYDETFTGFELRGKEWLLPKKHMEGATVVEFAEAAQFQDRMQDLDDGQWLAMLDVMVVLCRPSGEVYEYNEKRHNQRKNWFRALKMDVVANVSFFLLKLNSTLQNNLLIYGLTMELERQEARKFPEAMDGI